MSWCSRCEATPWSRWRQAVRERMTTAAQLSVPLQVDVGTGANWDEAH